MQNMSQEVNVRVAVRVRPLLPKEKLSGETSCVRIHPSTNQLVLGKDRSFTFDHILASKSSQEAAHEVTVDHLVKSCFEGYNATVFAYGQTGSGKTFTIGGGNIAQQTEEEFGIIPRAVKQMFTHIQNCTNREFTVKVSYLEIYKEEMRDLLNMDTSSKDLHIREDDKGNTLIIGVSEVECDTLEEVMACLESGSASRHTGSTQMNEHSSRSHSVFTIFIEQSWVDTEDGGAERQRSRKASDASEVLIDDNGEIEHYMCAKFHFVDLAGSERAHRTGNVGDRLKESVHINSGLLALGNVISALGDTKKKVTHIPYRDSKITRLLKDSLGGNAKTVMICCISPASSSFDESLNALKYANRARNIKNKPIVNRDPQSIRFEEMQSEIKALREELQRQRTSLIPGTGMDSEVKRAIGDVGQIKQLEESLARLQTECAHYRMIAEEAYKQLMEVQSRNILSQSQNIRLSDWMELMEEIKNKVPSTLDKEAWDNQTIAKLEIELKQCKNDLKSDEEIFAEKVKEMSSLQDKIKELEESNAEYANQLEQCEERLKLQEEQLVDRNVTMQELQTKLKEAEEKHLLLDSSIDAMSGPPTTTRRAKSVPVQALTDRQIKREEFTRNIHTSPALFSLERVMQGFRARSQLIVSRLEDNDDVQQQHFSDDEVFDSGDEVDGSGATRADDNKENTNRSAFNRGDKSRGTYRVKRPKISRPALRSNSLDDDDQPISRKSQEDLLRKSQTDDEKLSSIKTSTSSTSTKNSQKIKRNKTFNKSDLGKLVTNKEDQKKLLKKTELEVRQSAQKMRDLSINIKLKEQLIKELVKTGKDAQSVNQQYRDKIMKLEQEKQEAQAELASLQVSLHEVESRGQQDKVEKESIQLEFRKKMELAKTRLHALQKKQKETEKMANITSQSDKRIHDLELAIDRMKQQQDLLQKRLKDESDRKSKLEREMQKGNQQIKELEIRNEQQKKVLKVKTEEMTAMQRKLRGSAINAHVSSDEQTRLDDQKRWLDQEIEKVVQQRQAVEDVQKELVKREDAIAKKEAMLAERSELEIKKLRSSQLLNNNIVKVSSNLDVIDRKIEEKSHEMARTPRGEVQSKLKEELGKLQHGRDTIKKQREVLDGKLQEGAILTPQEERRLIELEEAIDALNAAIDYRNEQIDNKQQHIRNSFNSQSDDLMSKLRTLSSNETKILLSKYFEKVIDMRESERKLQQQCSELEVHIDEQERMIKELEGSMQRGGLETDRRLTLQQQDYEKKLQLMVRQLAESEKDLKAEIREKDKDIFYFKSKCRDMTKKLREVAAGGSVGALDTDRSDRSTENGEGDQHHREHSHRDPTSREPSHREPTPRENPPHRDPTPRETAAKSLNPRPPSTSSRSGSGSAKNGENPDKSARDGSGPIKISRKHLSRVSQEEISLRKSAAERSGTPRDSLDTGKNPWA